MNRFNMTSCWFLLWMTGMSPTAMAYTLIHGSNAVRWQTQTVEYYINPSGSGIDISELRPAIQAAFASWGQYTGISFQYAGVTTAKNSATDRRNIVFWDTDHTWVTFNDAYAKTSVTWDTSSGISDVDIGFATGTRSYIVPTSACSGIGQVGLRIGGVPLVWTIGRQGLGGIPFINSAYYADVQATATHEIGHFLGLGHSTVVNASMSTMNESPTFQCSTEQRTLKSDDIAGAQFLYSQVTLLYPPAGSIQWLTFIGGDPGIPGDGRTVLQDARSGWSYTLSPKVSLANVSNGITVTVFPAPATLGFQYLGIDYSNPLASPACRLSVNSGTPPQTGNVYTNGIRGSYTNITQNNLASMVQLMNIYYKPGCNIKVQDLVVTIIGLYDWQDGVFSPLRFTPLDAAAIGIGQNVVPLP